MDIIFQRAKESKRGVLYGLLQYSLFENKEEMILI